MLAIGLALLPPTRPLHADDPAPFAARTHAIRGQVHQVWSLRIAECDTPASDLLVLVTRGQPPRAEKRILWMPCGSALAPDDPRIVSRRLPEETALLDVARIPGRVGAQLVLASGSGLRIESLVDDRLPARTIAIPGGLALPTRPWALSRIPWVAVRLRVAPSRMTE